MFFTLDRIEDGEIAVMLSDSDEKVNVPLSIVQDEAKEGYVYTFENGLYIYNEKETADRKNSNREKFSRLLKKAKNKQ